MNIIIATNTIVGDEKAYSLAEMNEMCPDYSGFHRYQIIQVNRDGKLAQFRFDMGSVNKYKGVKQLRIPSLWEHSVDELRFLADELRYYHNFDYKDYLKLDKVIVA